MTDARGRRLPARIRVAGRALLVRADARGARYPVTIDPVFQQLAVLTNGAGSPGDALGESMSLSGTTLVVDAGSRNGKTYVFTEPPGGWATTAAPAAVLSVPG